MVVVGALGRKHKLYLQGEDLHNFSTKIRPLQDNAGPGRRPSVTRYEYKDIPGTAFGPFGPREAGPRHRGGPRSGSPRA